MKEILYDWPRSRPLRLPARTASRHACVATLDHFSGGRLDVAGGVTRPAIERAAHIGDGLTLAFRNWDATLAQIEWYRAAGGAGPITVKGGPMLADAEHKMRPTTWSEASMLDDLARLAETGVEEFAWDLNIVGDYEPARQVEILDWGCPART